jgi:NAD(P)H-flavin reductase
MSRDAEVQSALARDLAPEVTDPFLPMPYRVVSHHYETADTVTQELASLNGAALAFKPGQFNMLSAFGVGEVAISISGASDDGVRLQHTIRAVGAVSTALAESEVGKIVGVRGPFGTDWGVDDIGSNDVVVVAGGIGLAPLKCVVTSLLERARTGAGRLFVLVGARSPEDVVYKDELDKWRDSGAYVALTVDGAGPEWRGRVGLVTSLIPDAPFDPERSIAMMCGPEIMMRFTARALLDRGIDPASIRLSLERNMQCGIGLCGHCQVGPLLLCRDGPVVTYLGDVPDLMSRREL